MAVDFDMFFLSFDHSGLKLSIAFWVVNFVYFETKLTFGLAISGSQHIFASLSSLVENVPGAFDGGEAGGVGGWRLYWWCRTHWGLRVHRFCRLLRRCAAGLQSCIGNLEVFHKGLCEGVPGLSSRR